MTSKEALILLLRSHFGDERAKRKVDKYYDEIENQLLTDLDRLEEYKIANKVFASYLILFNSVSFDTFITTQCTDEEQEICREIFKEVFEND